MESKISLRQFLVLMTVSLLPAVIKIVPGKQALIAGRGGWLAAVPVLLPMLAAVWLVAQAGRRLTGAVGLGELLCLALGKPIGRALCGVYGVWLVLLSCTVLRFCAERFVSTIYPDSGRGMFSGVILALVWYLCGQKLEVLARTGQIFFYAVVLALGVVLVLSIGSWKPYNVWPVWTQDITPVLKASAALAGALSIGVSGLFLFGSVTEREGGAHLAAGWMCGLWGVMLLLGLGVMGVFGPALAGRLEVPFFNLAKEVTLGSSAERVEPLVVAVWVFADVVLLAVLLRGAQKAFEIGVGVALRLGSALVLVLLPGAYLVAGSGFAMENLYDRVLVPAGVALFYGVPVAALMIGRLRGKL